MSFVVHAINDLSTKKDSSMICEQDSIANSNRVVYSPSIKKNKKK